MRSLLLLLISLQAFSYAPNWGRDAKIEKGENRENLYQLSQEEYEQVTQDGLKHALVWPVSVTGLLIPYEAFNNFFELRDEKFVNFVLTTLGEKKFGVNSVESFYQWLGLNPYNDEDAAGIYRIPYPDGYKPDYYMGASIVDTKWGKGLTFSCATCHSASLFGTSVMGLTNKTVKANELFVKAKKLLPFIPTKTFQKVTNATDDEVAMLKRTKKNIHSVGASSPMVLGLDTSLPQVALSLAHRKQDAYATKSRLNEVFPRFNPLKSTVADSKPMPWWTLKYKTRWLSDGSIVAGNPIFTNFLWNELGRGTDLYELEKWLQDNPEIIKELTAAAFSTKAPRIDDFFDVSRIDIDAAKRGQKHFENRCQKCHGEYQKNWDLPFSGLMSKSDQIKTRKLIYHEKTPVKDVGTDPLRYQGTAYFADALNELAISKWMKTVVEPQKGYVPPPLNGIWARWPYMHNNSIPNLCELMTPPSKRVKEFYQIPAVDPMLDFDFDCNGFPVGMDIPEERRIREAYYNTKLPGLSNAGHYNRIFTDKEGNELLSEEDKSDLRMFLRTL
ncbi:hypothetical protein ABMA77_03500 [Halobacteriovorax sp. RZ-1]|uniref:c-type cytochrome n=1 Tax=unclassified Halobacteriovorax TaxID=2639665 RepID=UPI003719F2C0